MGLLGLVTAFGLVPLALYAPRTDGWRYLILSFVCLYAGRKVMQLLGARAALKQISMEEHFLKYGSSGRRVQKCVEHEDHLWKKSRVVDALKRISTNRLPTTLMIDEKRTRIYRRFRHAFRFMLPRFVVVDMGLVAAIVVGLVAAPILTVDLGAVMFQSGFLALAVAGAVEISRWAVNRQLAETLDRWFNALSEWTIREGFERLHLQAGPYSHRLLYFTQPWFADGSEDEENAREGLYVVTGDGEVLPRAISRIGDMD